MKSFQSKQNNNFESSSSRLKTQFHELIFNREISTLSKNIFFLLLSYSINEVYVTFEWTLIKSKRWFSSIIIIYYPLITPCLSIFELKKYFRITKEEEKNVVTLIRYSHHIWTYMKETSSLFIWSIEWIHSVNFKKIFIDKIKSNSWKLARISF